jgi:septal ring factor EnvC (AmiA/AmiB activator)
MIWNPWKRIRQLEAQLIRVADECSALDHALKQSADRYDKIREMNLQLRDTLTLYRNSDA